MEDIIPIEIIKKIIERVDSCADLASCRRINKKWNILSSESLKALHPVIPFSEARLSEFMSCMETSSLHDDIPFFKFHFQLDTFSTTENLILFHQKYGSQVRELGFELREKRLATLHNLEKLRMSFHLIHCSPHLTRLHLNISCQIMGIDAAGVAHLLPPASLPTLRSIELTRDITSARINDGRLSLLEALKNSAPNLEEIKLAPWKGTQLSRITPVLTIFKDTRKIVLRNVTLLTYHTLDAEALVNPNYKLTQLDLRLSFDFDKADENSLNYDRIRSLFSNWLEAHSETLLTLTLVLDGVSEMQIPPLRALKSLEVGLGTYDDVYMDNPLLSFQSSQFPSLKNVELNFYSEDWDLFPRDDPFEMVESLKLQGYQEAYVTQRWDLIFPNLKSLELICIKTEQVRMILRHLASIRILKVQLSDYMTDVIHGILTGSGNGDDGETIGCPIDRLTRLETLEIGGCGPITLDKIVTMTKDGSLKPLVNLSIDPDTISEEQTEVLKSVHANVNKIRRVRK